MPKRTPGVRLSGGAHGGRVLAVPKGARPTEGRVREALFSIWAPVLPGAKVLDLFAGSGAVGLEAAGRGALEVLAIESNPQACKTLEANRRLLKEPQVELKRLRLPTGLHTLAQEGRRFDLIFADPPYAYEDYEGLLQALPPLLARDGEIVVEHSSRVRLPLEVPPLIRTDSRRYGESGLSFYRGVATSEPNSYPTLGRDRM